MIKSKRIDLVGQVFGRLTVLSYDVERTESPTNRHRQTFWKCKCLCGSICSVASGKLRPGLTKSCGCIHRDMLIARNKRPDGQAGMTFLYHSYKRGANKRHYEWELTRGQFAVLCKMPCHYCGTGPSNRSRESRSSVPVVYTGLDRVDNSRGYILGNVVPSCRRCNVRKHTSSYSEFLQWISTVHDRHINHIRSINSYGGGG